MGRATNLSNQLLYGLRNRNTTTLAQWPASTYVALLSTNPSFNDMAGAVETPYTGYTAATSRQAIASSTSGWNAMSTVTGVNAVTMTNAGALNFPSATGSGTITGVALCYDNSTTIATNPAMTNSTGVFAAGTYYWVAITSQSVANLNTVSIAASALTLSED